MLVLITYDVSTQDSEGSRRLRNVAKVCQAYGQRVQNSVFECALSETQFREMQHQLTQIIDMQQDSLRFYILGNHYQNKVVHVGAKPTCLPDDTLIL